MIGIVGNVSVQPWARYRAQPKPAGFFSEDPSELSGISGMRPVQTLHANTRLFLQIRDGETGSITREGTDEVI